MALRKLCDAGHAPRVEKCHQRTESTRRAPSLRRKGPLPPTEKKMAVVLIYSRLLRQRSCLRCQLVALRPRSPRGEAREQYGCTWQRHPFIACDELLVRATTEQLRKATSPRAAQSVCGFRLRRAAAPSGCNAGAVVGVGTLTFVDFL